MLKKGIGIFLIFTGISALSTGDFSSFIVLAAIGIVLIVKSSQPKIISTMPTAPEGRTDGRFLAGVRRRLTGAMPDNQVPGNLMPEDQRRTGINNVKTEYMKIFRIGIGNDEKNRRCEEFAEAYWVYQYYLFDRSASEELLRFAQSNSVMYTGSKYSPNSISTVMQDQDAALRYFYGRV